jgi:hypothetical protein
MSRLPKQKKSPEEIAKLREELGAQGPLGTEQYQKTPEVPAPIPVDIAPLPVADPQLTPLTSSPPEYTTLLPSAPPPAKQVRSLKRSELATNPVPIPVPAGQIDPAATHLLATKIVKSLRKAERFKPASSAPILPDSIVPSQRHSEQEIAQLQRKQAFEERRNITPPPSFFTHLASILPGYLFAVIPPVITYFYELTPHFLCISLGLSLACAVFLFLKKPISRHHAAFIAALVLLIGIFSALHFIPQLRHGT